VDISEFGAEWATVAVVGVFAVTSPGPDMLVTLHSSLTGSSRAGLLTSLGIALGLCWHTTYSLLGLAVLVSQSVVVFTVLKYVGAAYLVYVGWKALRSGRTELAVDATARGLTDRQAFRMGLLTNLTNPKVTLFFLALFTQVIDADTPSAAKLLYGGTVIAISLAWFGFLALVVGHEAVRGRLQAWMQWVERVAGVLFIGLGVRLALARAAR